MSKKQISRPPRRHRKTAVALPGYDHVLADIVGLLEAARRASARAVNVLMTATYWEVGRRIVQQEQGGGRRAEYGATLIASLSADLTARYGRGFSMRNLEQMRLFYLAWPIAQTVSAQSHSPTQLSPMIRRFSLPWSHYVKLLAVQDRKARTFYESEALRGGWSVRQLDRQIASKLVCPTRYWLPNIERRCPTSRYLLPS